MPEQLTAETVPFTPERAALVRASHYAEALAALLEAKATEHEDPAAGPVFVDAVEAFDLDPAGSPSHESESLWELVLAGLMAEGVGPLEVEGMAQSGPDGLDVCQLSARLAEEMTPDHLARLGCWRSMARELAALRLADGLAYCERLAAEADPKAAPAVEVTARGGELLRIVRELAEGVATAPKDTTPNGCEALADRIDAAAGRLADAAHGVGPDMGHALAHYTAETLALTDRVGRLLCYLEPPAPAAAGARA